MSLHCSDQTDCRWLNIIAFLNINFRYFRFRIYFNWDIFFIMGFVLLRHKITFYFAIFFISTISSDKRKKDLKCTGWINIKISGKKLPFFKIWPTNFKLNFLSSQMVKMQNFSVYLMQNFLNFSKMVVLLILALFF